MNTKKVHALVFEWWRANGRILPWRERRVESTLGVRDDVFNSYFHSHLFRDPYRVVVSEIMLQQTQVDRVVDKYTHWMEKWPTINDLSHAKLSEVLIEWKGLGYNRRAKFLWLLSKEIVEQRQGIWPETEQELMQLPGIGMYTARALLSFCFGKQVGVVDTNVKRILQRLYDVREDEKFDYVQRADSLLPPGQADPWNQALMDFGALICTANKPKCDECPLAACCAKNIAAKAAGFEHYAAYAQVESKKLKQTQPKKTVRFEETDRFLRGRIIDLLREKEWKVDEIKEYLSNKYTQFSVERISVAIQQLIAEELVSESNERIFLP